MQKYKMAAPCLFGVEGILADELKRISAENVQSENGRVCFEGDLAMLADANIWLRTAERVLLVVGEFDATTFTELFDRVKGLPWESFIGCTDTFPVIGYSLSSQLHSVPDCQSIIKKAIVERLRAVYKVDWFEETGPMHKVRFSINKNRVTVSIDTSGDGLHKRGYRAQSLIAPIKETLAAAMCSLARIYPDTVLYDPFCGSGTILIEAAMMAMNIAPGLKRFFAAERFGESYRQAFADARNRALAAIRNDVTFQAHGSDNDPEAVQLTLQNAEKAGVGALVTAKLQDVKDFSAPEERMLLITNPPYGERLLDVQNAERLYKTMGQVMPMRRGKKYFIISPNDDFEQCFGRPSDKRRKLYNGMIKCQLFMYFKERSGDESR